MTPDTFLFSDQPFDPYHLRPLATLNSRPVRAVPAADPEWVGKTGWDLLSRHALLELIGPHAAQFGWGAADPGEYPRRLNDRLDEPGGAGYPMASAIAEEFGRRLGCLIASIILSPVGLTSPLARWEEGYLRWWREGARQVFLGGGHATGRLGEAISHAAQDALARCGLGDRAVRAAPDPSFLPLIGAARSEVGAERARVVADFGGTRAKRGLAFYDAAGRLARLQVLPPRDISTLTASGDARGLAEAMVRIIAETARAAGDAVSPRVVCSVAAYVEDGRPLNIDRGIYTWLNRLAPDVKMWFSEQISLACGREIRLEFAHDCDAAACALCGAPASAVIMLGSAMGVGFVPPVGRCCPVADGFAVDSGSTMEINQ